MDFALARHNMVESQIRANRVTDPLIIAAMAEVPRERFVPQRLQGVAYMDDSLPVGEGRALMEPMALARLLQAAEIRPDDVALDVACGTGYTAAVLARLASTVVAVDSDTRLVAQATRNLTDLEVDTVAVIDGPLAEGYPRQAPYDVILFEGAVAAVPQSILDQLAEGGRLVAVVNPTGRIGSARLFTRVDGVVGARALFEIGIPPLPEFAAAPRFTF